MKTSRRGLFGLFASLPFIGQSVAAAPVAEAFTEAKLKDAIKACWADGETPADEIYVITPEETPFMQWIEGRDART